VSLVNLDPNKAVDIEAHIEGQNFSSVSGRILTANTMDAHNTAEAPNEVKPVAFTAATLESATLRLQLPSKSLVVLALKGD